MALNGEGVDSLEEEAKAYNDKIEAMREIEYPMLRDTLYLDHAGTTLYAKSLINRFSTDMIDNLYGNPHSFSNASLNSARKIDAVRSRLLRFFSANPQDFDVVFVANASAGIKLVAEAFQGLETGFWYGYHEHSHTSLLGIRELATFHRCFETDTDVNSWIEHGCTNDRDNMRPGLFAYPAQSNFDGRRFSPSWCSAIRQSGHGRVYTMYDAAALVSTSPLDLSDPSSAPDFITLSLYKIFGFPDLGALIVRKSSAEILRSRRYFGGGTVEMITSGLNPWHSMKVDSIHQRLEDGTLPIHNIMAVDHAISVHEDLYGSLKRISKHCAYLADKLHQGLASLRHANRKLVCQLYMSEASRFDDPATQGPIIAFNIKNSDGTWFSTAEVEKLTALKGICLRTGGVCNPGGVAAALQLSPDELRQNFAAGQRCDNDNDIIAGKPTGIIRISLGAMSTLSDVRTFLDFMHEYLVDHRSDLSLANKPANPLKNSDFFVEAITVFPIKSCAGYHVDPGIPWPILPEGLAWDREWCLVHAGTGIALSQKRYPRMALIRPRIDLRQGLLRVEFADNTADLPPISLPLRREVKHVSLWLDRCMSSAKVCGDIVQIEVYTSPKVAEFFSKALGVQCQLARFPPTNALISARHSKAHLQSFQHSTKIKNGTALEQDQPSEINRPILLSNESPILVVSRSSLNRLNENIKANGGKAVSAEAFRANIVVAENRKDPTLDESPFAEDHWDKLMIGEETFQMLGSCRRCQMVCVDQQTGVKRQEPFSTLAKTRRFGGKVFFGQHACHINHETQQPDEHGPPTIVVGDVAIPLD